MPSGAISRAERSAKMQELPRRRLLPRGYSHAAALPFRSLLLGWICDAIPVAAHAGAARMVPLLGTSCMDRDWLARTTNGLGALPRLRRAATRTRRNVSDSSCDFTHFLWMRRTYGGYLPCVGGLWVAFEGVVGCSRGERCDADGSRMGELCEMCVGSKTDTACYR